MKVRKRTYEYGGKRWYNERGRIMKSFIICSIHFLCVRKSYQRRFIHSVNSVVNAYELTSVGKPEVKRKFGEARHIWKNNIKMDVKKYDAIMGRN